MHAFNPTDVPGFTHAFLFGNEGEPRKIDAPDIAAALAAPDEGWLWLHLNLTDQRCGYWLEAQARLDPLIIAFFAKPPAYQSIETAGGRVIGSLSDLRQDFAGESHEAARLNFCLSERLLLTARTRPLQAVEHLRRSLEHGQPFASPAKLLRRLLGLNAERLQALVDELSVEVEFVEEHVFDDHIGDERKRALSVRREAARLHRTQRGLRRALTEALREHDDFVPGLAALVELHAHIDQEFQTLEARARLLHDEIDAKLAAETNSQLYRLSVLTALFLPPTLIVGVFGMNVGGMVWAESPWGLLFACLLAAGASALTWFLLDRLARKGER
ncbi:MAG: CorA family divalent cation transporter [Parvibaculaceae bacterium]